MRCKFNLSALFQMKRNTKRERGARRKEARPRSLASRAPCLLGAVSALANGEWRRNKSLLAYFMGFVAEKRFGAISGEEKEEKEKEEEEEERGRRQEGDCYL